MAHDAIVLPQGAPEAALTLPASLEEFELLAALSQSTDSGPVREPARITSLDLIRGVAVLGILLMNAVYFKLGGAPYFNLSAGGSETRLDWAVGIFGEVFIDQKFMGLFALLFGAGMILFIDRASRGGRRAVALNLWRNALLLVIGVLHFLVWDGDVLMVYAVSSVILLALRKLPNWALISVGVTVFALSVATALLTQHIADTTSASLSGLWTPGEVSDPEVIAAPFLLGYFLRAMGLILVGAGLYRTGFMNGGMPARTYRLTAMVGLAVGLPLAAAGVIIVAVNDHSREIAFIGQIPNTLGTIPASLGVHEPDHPLEQTRGQLAEATSTRSWEDGIDQLLGADGAGRACLDNLARRCRLYEPKRRLGVCARGVDAAGVVVAGVVESLPLRTRRVALASRYISKRTVASPPQRLAGRSIGKRQLLEFTMEY